MADRCTKPARPLRSSSRAGRASAGRSTRERRARVLVMRAPSTSRRMGPRALDGSPAVMAWPCRGSMRGARSYPLLEADAHLQGLQGSLVLAQQGGVFALGLRAREAVVLCLLDDVGGGLPGLAEQALLVAQIVIVAPVVVLPAAGLPRAHPLHEPPQALDDRLGPRHAAGDVHVHGHVIVELLGGGVALPVHAAVDGAGADADDVLG